MSVFISLKGGKQLPSLVRKVSSSSQEGELTKAFKCSVL